MVTQEIDLYIGSLENVKKQLMYIAGHSVLLGVLLCMLKLLLYAVAYKRVSKRYPSVSDFGF